MLRLVIRDEKAVLVLCPINKFTKALELFKDRVGGGGPDEGTAACIVVGYVLVNLLYQFAHTSEGSAPDRLLGDEREPALNLVEPARISGV